MKIRNTLKLAGLCLCNLIAKILGREEQPAVLMYHSFDHEQWRYGVDPAMLLNQIKFLVKHKTIVTLEDVVLYAQGKKDIQKNAVAISIDDGYEDTYTIFYPLAKKYNIPFTLFLTTDLSIKPNLGNLRRPSWDQIEEMVTSGLATLALHGHTHKSFPKAIEEGQQDFEIDHSAVILYEQVKKEPLFVAYPSGLYNSAVIDYLVSQKKWLAAFTAHTGFIGVGDDLFRLKRIEVNRSMSLFFFALRLAPGLPIYHRFVTQLKKYV